jgi:hypothetical protein
LDRLRSIKKAASFSLVVVTTSGQMAACYGLRGSVCGSVKKRFVMVRSTERARLPEGELLETLIAIRARCSTVHTYDTGVYKAGEIG